jgi:hypothetical protein
MELLSLKPTDRMPRPRQRVLLESGLKLDLNKLRRQRLVCPGAKREAIIRWTNTYTGEEIANGVITSSIEGAYEGWLRIKLGSFDQTIIPRSQETQFWRLSVVLSLPGNESLRIGPMDAFRSQPLLQPSGLG